MKPLSSLMLIVSCLAYIAWSVYHMPYFRSHPDDVNRKGKFTDEYYGETISASVSTSGLAVSMATTSGILAVPIHLYCMEVVNEWTPCRDVQEGDKFLGRLPDDYSGIGRALLMQEFKIEKGWYDTNGNVKAEEEPKK